MKHAIVSSISTRTVETYEFTQQEVIGALRTVGLLPAALPQTNLTERMAETEQAYVRVPGGGDWSSTDLSLDDRPLVVKITTETHS